MGGSETTSNTLFYKIQRTASTNVGLSDKEFMTVYGSHAVAGGIASSVTPAKINNAVVTIDTGKDTELYIMRKQLIIAVLLTIATGLLTGLLVNIGIQTKEYDRSHRFLKRPNGQGRVWPAVVKIRITGRL